jgi:hypothetical protein
MGAADIASAQVTISFTAAAAPNIAGVPISPWALVVVGIPMLLAAFGVLRRTKSGGVALLVAGTACLGSAALYPEAGYAYTAQPSPYLLVTSPTDVPESSYVADYSGWPVCGPIGYVWVGNGGSTDITITGIEFDSANGYQAFDPAANPYDTSPASFSGPAGVPVCTVGTVLSGSQTCIVWHDQLSEMC